MNPLLILMILSFSFSGFSQTEDPFSKFDIKVNLSCGNVGKKSEELKTIRKIIQEQDTTSLFSIINKEDSLLQLLGVIAFDNLKKRMKSNISEQQLQTIEEYKSRTTIVYMCNTCMTHELCTINELFKRRRNLARRRIDRYLKMD